MSGFVVTRRVAAVALFMTATFAGMASAGPLDDARAADKRGDYATALRLYSPLAEQGNARAQYEFGGMYGSGHGVPQDLVEAVKWYRCAGEQNFTDAQDALARMYANGQGVTKNYVQAHMWANLAAARFSGTGLNIAAGLRDNIAGEMTSAQIAEAQRLAREWTPRRADETKSCGAPAVR